MSGWRGTFTFADDRELPSGRSHTTSNIGHSTEDGEHRLVASPKSYDRLLAIGVGVVSQEPHAAPVP